MLRVDQAGNFLGSYMATLGLKCVDVFDYLVEA